MAPTELLTRKILNQLLGAELISVDPHNSPSNACRLSGSGSIDCDFSHVHWDVHLVDPDDDNGAIDSLTRNLLEQDWLYECASEGLDLWRELALHECLAFLHECMAQRSMPAPAGAKTMQTLERLLTRFSIGQTCNFTFRAARNAIDFNSTHPVSRRHAANTVPGFCERQAEKAVYEGWDVKPFTRHHRLPESVMAALFAHSIGRLGDRYWYSVPDGENLFHQGN